MILDNEDLSDEVLADPDLAQKQCRFCGRVLANYNSMRRHVRKTCKIAPTPQNGDAGMELLYEHTLRRQEARIANLEAQNHEMLGLVRNIAAGGGGVMTAQQAANGVAINTPGNRNQIAVDNSKKFYINVFGRETMEYVTEERIKAILDESLRAAPGIDSAAKMAIMKTAMLLYSDPEHPENHTCYISNKKTNNVMVHTKDGWEVLPSSLVTPPMARTCVDCLFTRQPYVDVDTYGPLMKELAQNEARYVAGADMRTILVRNRDLLVNSLKALPAVGSIDNLKPPNDISSEEILSEEILSEE